MPELSVLLSVLNSETYIGEAIQSVLNQTYPSFELIIVNDGSTDKTGEIIRSYAAKDSRIVVIELEFNLGTSKALNEGLKIARGTFITRQDGDDRSLPDRFEKQIRFLEEHPHISAVGSSAYIIDAFGGRTTLDFLVNEPEEIRRTLPDKMCLCGPTILLRKSSFETAGYFYSDDLSFSEDYDFCLRVSEKFLISNIYPPVYEYRIHPDSVSQSKRYVQVRNKAIALERSLVRHYTDTSPSQLLSFIARDYLRAYVLASASKQTGEALECLHKALSYNPEVLHVNGELPSIVSRYSPKTNETENIQFIELVYKELIPINKQLNKVKNRFLAKSYLIQADKSKESNRQTANLIAALRYSPGLLLNRGVIKRIIKNIFT